MPRVSGGVLRFAFGHVQLMLLLASRVKGFGFGVAFLMGGAYNVDCRIVDRAQGAKIISEVC